MAGIFGQEMNEVFDFKGDAMIQGKHKMIHTVGATGKVKFVPKPNNRGHFTGMFEKADYGLIRLSAASMPSSSSIAPGFGLKFLRNNRDSANLVAMYSVDGQPDFNFFANDFVTHIPPAKSNGLKALEKKFSEATDFIGLVGVSDWAKYDENGHKESNPKMPFSLRFEPHSDIHNIIPSNFRGEMTFLDDLEGVPANSNLYNVWAWDKPQQLGGHEILIGKLVLDGKLHKSKWADNNLFFRHDRQDDDLKYHPEWEPYVAR